MSNYGSLLVKEGRQVLFFERKYLFSPDKVFHIITEPNSFIQWYPFATGEMDLRVGVKIKFDDGEGTAYEAVITELDPPHTFYFQEVDDLIDIRLHISSQGCTLTFSHTFDDREMAIYTAAGWHRCLDVLDQIVNGKPVEWKDNSVELREFYRRNFLQND